MIVLCKTFYVTYFHTRYTWYDGIMQKLRKTDEIYVLLWKEREYKVEEDHDDDAGSCLCKIENLHLCELFFFCSILFFHYYYIKVFIKYDEALLEWVSVYMVYMEFVSGFRFYKEYFPGFTNVIKMPSNNKLKANDEMLSVIQSTRL